MTPAFDVFAQAGSSLLTRGKPIPFRCSGMEIRLIPAYAGKTPGIRFRYSRFSAHPCLRGENIQFRQVASQSAGSSLLTRGKQNDKLILYDARRLIPAYAGKTIFLHLRRRLDKAHPCLRGENFSISWKMVPFIGSSLLTRGKHSATSADAEPHPSLDITCFQLQSRRRPSTGT